MNNPYPCDQLRDSFLQFLSEGMTYAEALAEFDEDQFVKAAMAEVFHHEVYCYGMEWKTNDERELPGLFSLYARASREMQDARDMEFALALYAEGWTSEVPPTFQTNSRDFWRQCPVMSLYWRAPSKRPGRPGRRYLSTNQAYNAMKRSLSTQ